MISAHGLTKRYGASLAVDELSFDVLPGRVTGFLGPNGAGKSTTMRMILGLDLPTSGDVSVLGRPYREHRRPLHETAWRNDVINYLPANAGSQIFTVVPSNGALAPWTGLGVFCLYASAALTGAFVLIDRRDA